VEALLVGLGLGAAAGVSPGPLLVLVVTSALRSGWRAGVLAACAPLVSDVLVVTGVLLVLDRLPPYALGWLAFAGAALIAWTGLQTLVESRTAVLLPAGPVRRDPHPLRQAALINLVSPHPWIFWATVLGPLTIATWRDGHGGAVALVAGFYVAIVGAKAVIAVLVGRLRLRLRDRGYRFALAAAGVLLLGAAGALVVEFA